MYPRSPTREEKVRQIEDGETFRFPAIQSALKEVSERLEIELETLSFCKTHKHPYSKKDQVILIKDLVDVQILLSTLVNTLGWTNIFQPAFNIICEDKARTRSHRLSAKKLEERIGNLINENNLLSRISA